jgi:type II secretory pathway component GspD/PulD (secretin)
MVMALGSAQAQEVSAPAVPVDPAPPASVVEGIAAAPVDTPAPAPVAVGSAPAPAEAPAPAPVEMKAADADAALPATPAPDPVPTGGMLEVGAEEKAVEGAEVTSAGGENKISITLDNVPLQDVVRMFTRISGANIVSGTNLQGNVTVNLQDVEWEPALRVILDTTGNTLVEKTPGIFTIINKADLSGEPVVSDTIFLNYATVTNILPVVKSMVISSNGMASGFPGANAIVVQETASRVKAIKEIISRIDKARDQVLIETKFVELNDEAIKDIGLNWEVLQGYTMSISPQYQFGKSVQNSVTGGRNVSDVRSRALNDQRTRNDTNVRRDMEQDANVRYGSGVEGALSSAAIPGGAFAGTATDSSTDGSLSIKGNNFTDFDAKENKLTIVPRNDRTVTDTSIQGDNKLRTITDSITSGDNTTRTTTEALTAILSAEQFALTMSALKQNAGVEILSNPKVVVASGETATIHVGRNEPNIIAVPQGDTGDRYAYQLDASKPFIEIGVKLKVTPTLNTESNITVKITPELSRKLSDKSVGEAGTSFPVTQIRTIDTEFNLESGRTVAIGGLTETTDREVVKKVPLLGDIPFIGTYLFRHTHTEKVQDEVIIFVTVSSARPATLAQISGIPEEGRLIHRHLAQQAELRAKADQEKSRGNKSGKTVTLPE